MRTATLVSLACLTLSLLTGCSDPSGADAQETTEITTLETSPPELRPVIDPPQIEFDSGPAPALEVEGSGTGTQTAEAGEEEEMSPWVSDLPFSPKIAMDPVDGSKISIRAETPIAEYKGRIYYFGSEANRREFIRGPDQFLSGPFAAY